jgi:hypothetical protein
MTSRVCVTILLALVLPGSVLGGPSPQVKITISGDRLPAPIEITDEVALKHFFFGAGPGNHSSLGDARYWSEPSFIVDWAKGTAGGPPPGAELYQIEFLTSRTGKNRYRVTYAFDPVNERGFVYLPGRDDPRYEENVWLIVRGVEGNWLCSWSEWDALVKPLPGAR